MFRTNSSILVDFRRKFEYNPATLINVYFQYMRIGDENNALHNAFGDAGRMAK